VNPNDVENAVWHFLCVARAESPAAARAALLPVGPDSRAPMRQIYQMFRGELEPAAVLAAAPGDAAAEFFAQLYVGLFYEAMGRAAPSLEHITAAAAERFSAAGGYMHGVARVHLGLRR
jgi:lipoprotein NlpI